MPIVAKTAVSARSSGTPAATRAPKAISRMISVTGRDVISALPKSDWTMSLICCWVLASPNSPTVNPGCAFCTSSTAAKRRLHPVHDLGVVAGDLETEQRRASVAEIWFAFAGTSGLSKFWVWGTAASRRCTSSTHRAEGRDRRPSPRCSGSAPSPEACSGAASAIVWSARPDSPTPVWVCSRVFVPTAPPITKARTTKASHPQIAVLRCCALHLPARAARLRGVTPEARAS